MLDEFENIYQEQEQEDRHKTRIIILISFGVFLLLVGLIAMFVLLASSGDKSSFSYLDQQVQQCLASGQYTRDQCIALLGSRK